MNKKEIILKALAAKGLEAEPFDWEPIRKGGIMCGCEGGWTIFIDTNLTPLRGIDNPITGYNVNEVLDRIKMASRGYDYCPACKIGISRKEERMMFCENCRTDFSEIINKHNHD